MRKWLIITAAVMIASVILDVLVAGGHVHVEVPWSHIPAFFSLFGFIGCLAIIFGAKLLGHFWLQRGEDYYDKNDEYE